MWRIFHERGSVFLFGSLRAFPSQQFCNYNNISIASGEKIQQKYMRKWNSVLSKRECIWPRIKIICQKSFNFSGCIFAMSPRSPLIAERVPQSDVSGFDVHLLERSPRYVSPRSHYHSCQITFEVVFTFLNLFPFQLLSNSSLGYESAASWLNHCIIKSDLHFSVLYGWWILTKLCLFYQLCFSSMFIFL